MTEVTVVSVSTGVEESMLTGESLSIEKLAGSSITAGSLNDWGVIVVHLTGDNTISTTATMVDEANFSKPKIQELVDIVASNLCQLS